MSRSSSPGVKVFISDEKQPEKLELPLQEEKSAELITINIPYVPPKIDLADIKSNVKLLDDKEIEALKDKVKEFKDGRYSKKEMDLPYGVVKTGGKIFLIYSKKGKEAGEGGRSEIHIAQEVDSGKWYVLKKGKSSNWELKEDFDKEHAILKELKRAEGDVIVRNKKSDRKKTDKKLFNMIIEFERGEPLYDIINAKSRYNIKLPAVFGINIALQLANQLKEFLKKDILYCDIRLENIIFDFVHNTARLVDFGESEKFKPFEDEARSFKHFFGSEYAAPELQSKEKVVRYTEKTDVYALGILLKQVFGIMDVDTVPVNGHRISLSADVNTRIFLNRMTSFSPTDRPTFQDIINFFSTINGLVPQQFTVGVLDIAEYKKASDIEKQHLIQALRSTDKIMLVGNQSDLKDTVECKMELMQLKRSLEESGLNVMDEVGVGENLLQVLKKIPDRFQNKDPKSIFSFFYASSKDLPGEEMQALKERGIYLLKPDKEFKKADYAQKIRDCSPVIYMHYMKVRNVLHSELQRLQKKYSISGSSIREELNDSQQKALVRYKAIIGVRDKLKTMYDKKELNYKVLFAELEDLKLKTQSTKKYSILPMFEKKEFKGRKVLKTLTDAIEQDSDVAFSSKRKSQKH